MRLRYLFLLLVFLLPEQAMDPFRGALPPGLQHWLGTDELGRDGLLRLLLAALRSLAFASSAATLSLGGALVFVLGRIPGREARSALRGVPPTLLLLPLSALLGGLGWLGLLLLLSGLQALQLEAPMGARLAPFLEQSAWKVPVLLGAPSHHRWVTWTPFFSAQAGGLYPGAWITALWGEVTLSALGLGPGPEVDSLGRILGEQLPRLTTDPTSLGWGALFTVLGLAWASTPRRRKP